ncbi:hypothetical protein BGC07_07205 [Piscirickettsia litoralis]|uniref:Uncharacterized protein n=1 Tax=Piscirickettsia litoralis TaxID=1891921 RepID=A0ABX3A1P9_9GAMM|nr:hypothetical protein BGC07_07205 [Piscirickettsia litoralis]
MSAWLSQADRGSLIGLRIMLKLISLPGGRPVAKLIIWLISSYFFAFRFAVVRPQSNFYRK